MTPIIIAIGASIAAFWNQARGIFEKVISIFIRSEEINYKIALPFLERIYPDCKKIGVGNSCYNWGQDFDINGAPVDFLFYKKNSFFILYKNWHPAIISSKDYSSLTITYIAGTFPLLDILEDIGLKISSKINDKEKFSILRIFGEGRPLQEKPLPEAKPTATTTVTGDDSFFSYFRSKEWVNGLGVDFKIFDFERKTPKKNFYWHETGKKN